MKDIIEKSLDADKAENIISVNLSKNSAMADYMIIASGTSSRHVNALARKLKEKLQSHNVKGINIEGMPQCDWIVMDAGDVIVHLFRPEAREFYSIEKMWCENHPNMDIVPDHIQV